MVLVHKAAPICEGQERGRPLGLGVGAFHKHGNFLGNHKTQAYLPESPQRSFLCHACTIWAAATVGTLGGVCTQQGQGRGEGPGVQGSSSG